MKIKILFGILCLIGNGVLIAQEKNNEPEFLEYRNSVWVDSIMKELSPDERIAQLIMVAAYSNRGEEHKQEILNLIEEHKIGGLIFFQGDPESQVRLMNEYQEASEVPLLGAIDAEWGLGMRLDHTINYPFQMALGAVQEDSLVRDLGKEIARQVKRSGLHMNFAPVVDVNNNPRNPVINFRSFGEDKYNVSRKAIAYMKGMQEMNVFSTAKHFPGHGDTDTDSHYALPQINHSWDRLDSLELYPFKKILKAGIGGVMVAHLNIPALDSSGVASTLSRPIVTDLLKDKLGFKGLVVTDAMNMKGVTKNNLPGVVDKDAVLAGNDLLEFTEDVSRAILEIKKAVQEGKISQEEIDDKVRKILAVKQWVGLQNYERTKSENIVADLSPPHAKLLQRHLVEASLTVLRNSGEILPVQDLSEKRIASVSFGVDKISPFQETLGLYADITHFFLPVDADGMAVESLKNQLENYDLVIGSVHDQSRFPRNRLEISEGAKQLISELSTKGNTVFTFFKNPYVLDQIEAIENTSGLIMAYQDSRLVQEVAAQLIFGGIGANGKLPVSVGDKFELGEGISVKGGMRLSYTLPEDAEMDSRVLQTQIDSLMKEAMQVKAIPGGQVLIARNQKVVFHKAYGMQSYFDTVTVKKNDLYDLASVTKIAATIPALMKLFDEDKFQLDGTLPNYLPSFRRSNKANIPFTDILTHQARFQPWIPFWKNTLRKNGSYKWWTIKDEPSARYPIRITDQMFLHRNYPDKIVKTIRDSPLREKKEYVYSDFFFILAPRVVESRIALDFASYLQAEFYKPLGAATIGFNPTIPKYRIAPTEYDFNFRKEPIHGTVHDEAAIMMGGVSGHAGLFANANDLAKLLQMYLNSGIYGGRRYLEQETLELFTRTTFPGSGNYRALGFDKRRPNKEGKVNNTAPDASKSSFGHTGFTGVMVWMDPEQELLYIFLANRVHPTRENSRLYQLDTRTRIHQVAYDAIHSFSRADQEQ